jgi:hypothetical protein
MFRPIPLGTKLFCAKRKGSFPYNTMENIFVYDPYKYEKLCNYFITYNQPVPNTVPLYLHKLNNNIFPSFDKNPPSSHSGWKQSSLSPIFVMTEETVGPDPDKIKFHCVNDRCLPIGITKINDIYDDIYKIARPLGECVVMCGEIDVSYSVTPIDLLENISKSNSNQKIRYIQPIFISILLCFLVFILFMVIICLKNKHNINWRDR